MQMTHGASLTPAERTPSASGSLSRKRDRNAAEAALSTAGDSFGGHSRVQRSEAPVVIPSHLPAWQQLTREQRVIVQLFIQRLDTRRDSVVISNPLAPNAPIVHVTEAWQEMCGYKLEDAVGRNPALTQGPESDKQTIQQMRHAVSTRQACKVRIINYRGNTGEPFWNCLTMHPIFYHNKLVLYAARLQDYSYRLTKLVSLTPTQFCKCNERICCRIRLTRVRNAACLSEPVRIDADIAALNISADGADASANADADGRIEEADEVEEVLPPIPTQLVKRLAIQRVALEAEYLMERLRDECQLMQLPCQAHELVAGGAELMRLEVQQAPGGYDGQGVRAVLLVLPEDAEGHHCISFTRLSGDTFQFHALFRALKKRLCDLALEVIHAPAEAAAAAADSAPSSALIDVAG